MKIPFPFPSHIGLASLLLSSAIFAQEPVPEPAPEIEPAKPQVSVTDLAFKAHDDVEMFGRLVLPKSNSPRAVLIYVQTAEGATLDMKRPLGAGRTFNYYDLYREKLPAMDIGFFSYEGRGVRMGDELPRFEQIDWDIYNTSTLDNKVKDLLSAVQVVHKQEGLQHTPILLMGASEGTLLISEAASRQPDEIAGLVLYGVMAKNLRETFLYMLAEGGFVPYKFADENNDMVITEEEWNKVAKISKFSDLDLNKDGKFTVDDILVITQTLIDSVDQNDYAALQEWAKTGAAVSIPEHWFEDHFAHAEMMSFLSQLDMPVGLFQGDTDALTPIAAVKDLEAQAKKAKLSKMEFHYFEGLGHTLDIGQYFLNGELPAGHQAIFEFINRIVPMH
jgi:pimeloyl-ACP methyl ester carboxylesterase